MAYAWTAVYGYYVNTNASGHGQASLENVYTTDQDFVITSPTTLYTIAETTTLPSPKSLSTVSYETALPRLQTLTEYRYVTVIPYLDYDADYPTMAALYPKLTTVTERLIPSAFYYSRSLLSACVSQFGTTYMTFVWLTDIDIVISAFGDVYTVGSDNKLTRVISQGNYFQNTYWSYSYNPVSTSRWTVNGRVWIPFLYSNSWYVNSIGVNYSENPQTHEAIESWYEIWWDNNRTSTRQNELNQYLIGTPDNPRYKYKTDPSDPDTDPYIPPFSPSTPSKPGGGEGTHDPNPGNDPAPIPDITQMTSILDTEFMTAYKMTATGLKNLGSFLWSQNFYGVIANVLSSPFDVIIGLHIVPVNPTLEDSARTILLGNVDSLIAARRVTSQYVEKDLGGFDVPHIWGAYLDYQGKFEIFLPFIGFRSIAADDIVGHEIRVKYHIDVITGACIAYVLTDNYVTYTFAGSCSYNIPITGQNFTNIVSSMIQTAGTIGMAAIAPEGMGAAGAMAVAGSSLNTAMTKPTYSRSGGMGGNSGFMGMRTPVLIARVPNIAIPGNQNKISGYPSFITRKLSELSGYTEVYKVHLEGIGATDTEKAEIERALMEGVEL